MVKHPSTARAIYFRYRNWRGDLSVRHATPVSMRFGRSEWHPKPQWLLRAYDHDKCAEREFALLDCDFGIANGLPNA
ncbi:MAG: hypothetical protein AAF330_05270 [Pseudomonadota bacterium]